MNEVIQELVVKIMQCHDVMCSKDFESYEPTVKFGEYASLDFGTTVDTVGKAKQYGIMSLMASLIWNMDRHQAEETAGYQEGMENSRYE